MSSPRPQSQPSIITESERLDRVLTLRESIEIANNPATSDNIVRAAAGNQIPGQSSVSASDSLPLTIEESNSENRLRSYDQTRENGEYLRRRMEYYMCYLQDRVNCCQNRSDFLMVLDWIFRQNPEIFRHILFDRQGAYCLAKIIKKLKPTDGLALFLTGCLAVWFYGLMTNPVSKILIINCFRHLRGKPNEALYRKLSFHFYDLAKHEIGCVSVNECIDTIYGEEKETLMERIALRSVDLSYDIHGNYVVQHVLEQKYEASNEIIVQSLKGHFVRLSQLKEGSHVVEKCLECCGKFGIFAIVYEILHEGAVYPLARHSFGNYVIQKALRKTAAVPECRHLFLLLVQDLEPHKKQLQYTASGKHVVDLMKQEFGLGETSQQGG